VFAVRPDGFQAVDLQPAGMRDQIVGQHQLGLFDFFQRQRQRCAFDFDLYILRFEAEQPAFESFATIDRRRVSSFASKPAKRS